MDEFIGYFVCFGMFALLIIVPIWLGLVSRKTLAMQQVGNRFGGTATGDHFLGRAKLQFRYGDTMVMVTYCRKFPGLGGRQTEIRMRVPHRSSKIEIRRNMGKTRLWWIGKETVWESGDENFDKTFVSVSSHRSSTEEIITPAIRWQLMQLFSLGAPGLYFAINKGEMIISKPRFLIKQQALDDFVRLSLELYDQLMLARAVGIDFVQDQTAVIDEVVCPVCSCDIQGEMVICIRCKSPHCHECWKYNGKCATFACGETRYVIPVAKSPEHKQTPDA